MKLISNKFVTNCVQSLSCYTEQENIHEIQLIWTNLLENIAYIWKMKTTISIVAMLSILLGSASMVTPRPGGTLLITGGLAVLICANPTAQYCLMWIRSRANWFNSVVSWLETKIGYRVKLIGDAFKRTRAWQIGTILSHKEFVSPFAMDNDSKQ